LISWQNLLTTPLSKLSSFEFDILIINILVLLLIPSFSSRLNLDSIHFRSISAAESDWIYEIVSEQKILEAIKQ